MNTVDESANPDAEPKSFEAALERLEAIVEELEEGEPSLEKAVLLYEEGVKLFRYSREQVERGAKKGGRTRRGIGGNTIVAAVRRW